MRAALSIPLNVRLALLAVYHYLLCWLSLVENMVPINCRIFVCILVVSPVCDTNTIDTIALLRWHHHHRGHNNNNKILRVFIHMYAMC